jgi:hypothetical protein
MVGAEHADADFRESAAQRTGVQVLHAGLFAATALWVAFTLWGGPWLVAVLAAGGLLLLAVSAFLAHAGDGAAVRLAWFGWVVAALAASQVSLGTHAGIWTGFRFDDGLGWYIAPNLRDRVLHGATGDYHVTTDALGHRNRLAYPADGRLPVVLQGDSNAFGDGLAESETFCALYGAATGEDCYNFGIPGFGPQHFYFQYQDVVAPRFRPGRRIILFNYGNDYSMAALATPYLLPRPYLVRDGDGVRAVRPAPPTVRKQVYGNHFIAPYAAYDPGMATVQLGQDWGRAFPAWLAPVRLAAFAVETAYPPLRSAGYRLFARDALKQGRRLSPYFPPWQYAAAAHWPEPYRSFRRDFIAVMAAIGAQHPDTVVVAFPMRKQVLPSDAELGERLAKAGLPADAVDRFALNDLLAQAARAGGFRLIDVTPAFRAAPDKAALYQPDDDHLSAAGMRLVVDTVVPQLP